MSGCSSTQGILKVMESLSPHAAESHSLIGLSRAEMSDLLTQWGLPRFRLNQLWHWIYTQGATDFSQMTSLGKALQADLAERTTLARPTVVRDEVSTDGTRKWLLRFADGQEVETVFIPEDDRGTLCVSSQVGCTLSCRFCHTGTQKWVRNLTPQEIVGQLLLARDHLGDWKNPTQRRITNIVMMGMGEPLYNYENVAKALKIYMDPEGLALSKRRITLSTAGVVPVMQTCGEELGVNLAVSLHAVKDEIRDVIVPLNKKYPIAQLMEACRSYPGITNARRITFEYVMLKGVNDTVEDARALVRLIRGIPAKINLIPFNPWPGSPYECSDPATIDAFAQVVMKAGYASPIRAPRGRDILAACGQLKSESQRLRASERTAESGLYRQPSA